MVQVSRAYESTAKMMDAQSDLSRRAVERLGRAQ
jgi:flagellar basal body rod protein FlgG